MSSETLESFAPEPARASCSHVWAILPDAFTVEAGGRHRLNVCVLCHLEQWSDRRTVGEWKNRPYAFLEGLPA